jgi:branched-chain amino acid transport system ATP-binding protein
MTTPLLAVRDLAKSYDSLKVTDNIDLDIAAGELHALIGPNGAGKTTLIHQLSGLVPSDGGTVTFDGRDITRRSMSERARLGLARSFQITSILPAYTVIENVALAVQAHSGSSFSFFDAVASDDRLNAPAREALASVGLGSRETIRAGLLSHGEKRLLEIAIAISTAPKCLLLDEPLAGLGQEESKASIALLQTLKQRFTIVLVEHDMDAVFALADRVSVLVSGRVIATGTPAAIRANADVRQAYLGEEEAA